MRSDPPLVTAPPEKPSLLVDVQSGSDTGSSRVAVFGDLDHLNAATLQQAVVHVLRRDQPGLIEIDLAGVPFLDTGGIRALAVCRADARQLGCEIVLTRVQPRVHRVLEIVGLVEVFGASRL